MSIVMGLDQHRAQISAEWIDTITGEVSRARVAPADRAAVRAFLGRSRRQGSRSRWRRRRAGGSWSRSSSGSAPRCTWPSRPRRRAEGQEEAREDRLGRRPASARAAADRPCAGVVDPARAHPRSPRPGPHAASALPSADRVAAADARRALSPRVPQRRDLLTVAKREWLASLTLPAAAREQLTIALQRDRRARAQAHPV
jgi:hypothetical protein